MKFPRPRLRVRTMIGLVAVAAVALWAWRTYFDPVRLWQAAIRDHYDFNSRWTSIQDAAQGKIRGLDPDLAIGELIGLLGDKSQNLVVRSTAAEGLGGFKDRARGGIPALVAALGDPSPGVRIKSIIAIRAILGNNPVDDPITREAVAGLVAALKDPDSRVRYWSAWTLSFVGHCEVAIPTLIDAWNEPDLYYMERMRVIEALRRSGLKAAEAVPAILATAKVALIDVGNQPASVTRQGNASALIHAALFLHDYGHPDRAAQILREVAADRDPQIAAEARKTLQAIESTLSLRQQLERTTHERNPLHPR